MIKKDDYIKGYEYFGTKIRQIKGWVDKVRTSENETIYEIQADDEYKGARGTMLFTSLGEVEFLSSDYPRVYNN